MELPDQENLITILTVNKPVAQNILLSPAAQSFSDFHTSLFVYNGTFSHEPILYSWKMQNKLPGY